MGNNFEVLLEEWRRFEFPNIIERYIHPQPSSHITAIVGPRRAGKTFLLYLIARDLLRKYPRDNVIYVNFDDERIRKEPFENLLEAIHKVFNPKGKIFLLLDEIQNVSNWSGWLGTLHNMQKYSIFVAGSSSKLLSMEVATSLRGRYISYTLLPFSFREFLKMKNIEERRTYIYEDVGLIKRLLDEYIEYGSFPEVIKEQSRIQKKRVLKTIFETIFFKDVVERFRIRNFDIARDILEFLLVNYSNKITINKLYNFLSSIGRKVSKKTLWKYIYYFQQAFAVMLLEPLTSKKKRLLLPRKIYSIDTGISRLLDIEPSRGRLIENIVFLELVRRKERELFDIYYFYGRDYEVDFVVTEGRRVIRLIQVCYNIEDFEVARREIRGLMKAAKQLECNNLEIITWDHEDIWNINGLKVKLTPLWKWLLKPL